LSNMARFYAQGDLGMISEGKNYLQDDHERMAGDDHVNHA
jgi:hypothetical protein